MSENRSPPVGVTLSDEARESGSLYIKQVARIVGVSPSVLRAWENERLIKPGRSASGYRTYRASDVDRLIRIRDLILTEGLNPAGVRRLLAREPAGTDSTAQQSTSLPGRLQLMRRRQRLTLRQLSVATGLSASTISALERGASAPSVATLRRLAEAYGTTVPAMLGTQSSPGKVVIHPHERQDLDLGIEGVRYQSLFSDGPLLQAMMILVEPGAGSLESYSHDGEEFLFLIAGSLTLVLDELHVHDVQAGDAMAFASTRPHRWHNPGATRTEMIWVNTPPSF